MVLDQALIFADKQVVTAGAAAANIIDLGPLKGGIGVNPVRDIGAGEPLWFYLASSLDVAPAAATVGIALDTSDAEAMSAPIALGTVLLAPANTKAGGLFVARINPAPFHRYLRASFVITGGPLTQGTFTSGITWNVDVWRAYASGFTTGVFGAQGP